MTCTCQDYDPLCLHNHGGVDGRGDLVCQDCGASADCPHHGARREAIEGFVLAHAPEFVESMRAAVEDVLAEARGERSIYTPTQREGAT